MARGGRSLSAPLRAVRVWLLDPYPMYAMVANRVVLGGVLLGFYLVRLTEYGLIYGAESIAWFPLFRTFVRESWMPPLAPVVDFMSRHGLEPFTWLLYALLLVSAISFCVGFKTRLAGCTALVLHKLFEALNPEVSWGWSEVIVAMMIYTILAPTGRWFSVDAWLARRSGREHLAGSTWLAPAWPLRLMQINVCAMYAVAGWSRIDDPGWLEGKMLYDALTNSLFARFAIDWQPYQPLLMVLSYCVFVLEPAASVLLWIKPLRRWIALALIAMHVGLELLTNVGWWNFIMIGGLLCFLPADWLRKPFEIATRRAVPVQQESAESSATEPVGPYGR